MSSLWTALAGWFGRREPIVLLTLLVIVVGAWGFIEIADEVMEGETGAFDEWVLRSLRDPQNPAVPRGPGGLQLVARDITGLGGITVLSLLTVIIAAFLWLDRKHGLALFLLLATTSGMIVGFSLKAGFGRPRPSVVPHLVAAQTASFPSGHSMMSAVVYLTLGVLVASAVPYRIMKVYVIGVGLLLSGLVGLSRVYLGVHYPTDVLAGWTAGLVWALLCWLVARWLQQRGQVEADEAETVEDAGHESS
ncbi:MAG: phosphatase PAP2 family protein [Gemmataceae bacterium]